MARGLAEGKIVRVVGLADTLPGSASPAAPLNRRISIIVLNKQAEAALRGTKKLDVNTGGDDIGDIRAGLGAHRALRPSQAPKESTA